MSFNKRVSSRQNGDATRFKLAQMVFKLEMDEFDLRSKRSSTSPHHYGRAKEDVTPWRKQNKKKRNKKLPRKRSTEISPKYSGTKGATPNRFHWVTKLLTFGDNGHHQLGNRGGLMTKPAHVPMAANPIQVSCGPCFTMAVCDDGSLWSCGSSCLGIKDVVNVDKMHHIPMPAKVIRVACGWTDHCACVTSNLSLWTWGKGNAGKLGHGGAHSSLSSILQVPTRVEYFAKNDIQVVEVGCGCSFTICLDLKGRVFSFGCGKAGKLGLSNNLRDDKPKNMPEQVHLARLKPIQDTKPRWDAQMKEEEAMAVAAKMTNSAVDAHYHSEPTSFVPFASAVSCGNMHTCIITRRGALYTWGFNAQGQLGLGDTEHRGLPVHVDVNAFVATLQDLDDQQLEKLSQQVSRRLLRRAVLQVDKDGGVLERDALDALIKGSMVNSTSPINIAKKQKKPNSKRRTDVPWDPHSTSHSHSTHTTGAANKAVNRELSKKYRDNAPLCARVIDVAAGYNHTLILSNTGKVYSCGSAKFAQLGLLPAEMEEGHIIEERLAHQRGIRVDRASSDRLLLPHPVNLTRETLTGQTKVVVRRVGAGIGHSIAITDRGRVVSWGWGESGQLGLGDCHSETRPAFLHGFPMRHAAVGVGCGSTHSALIVGRQPSDLQFVDWSLNDCVHAHKPLELTTETTDPKAASKAKVVQTNKSDMPAYMRPTRAQNARTELLVPLERGSAVKRTRAMSQARQQIQIAAQASANRRRRQSRYRK